MHRADVRYTRRLKRRRVPVELKPPASCLHVAINVCMSVAMVSRPDVRRFVIYIWEWALYWCGSIVIEEKSSVFDCDACARREEEIASELRWICTGPVMHRPNSVWVRRRAPWPYGWLCFKKKQKKKLINTCLRRKMPSLWSTDR